MEVTSAEYTQHHNRKVTFKFYIKW